MEKFVIRPSSIKTYVNCPRKWYQQFILDKNTTGNAAATGTAIHAAVEAYWRNAKAQNEKSSLVDNWCEIGVEKFRELDKKVDIIYDDGASLDSCIDKVYMGATAYINDIAPALPMPEFVEHRVSYPIKDHPFVKAISGTIDYIGKDFIADLKTGKSKPSSRKHILQCSLYRKLARFCGIEREQFQIHAVTFVKDPEKRAHVFDSMINEKQASFIVNQLLDRLRKLNQEDPKLLFPDMLFPGNPEFYLCGPKFCPVYDNCPFSCGRANAEF